MEVDTTAGHKSESEPPSQNQKQAGLITLWRPPPTC